MTKEQLEWVCSQLDYLNNQLSGDPDTCTAQHHIIRAIDDLSKLLATRDVN